MKSTILIVDDLLFVLDAFKKCIPKEYDVVIASNLEQAKELCDIIQFDCVLIDINLASEGSEGGFKLVQHLVNMNFLGKIGIMSGYLFDIPKHLEEKISFQLIKPFSVGTLLEKINS